MWSQSTSLTACFLLLMSILGCCQEIPPPPPPPPSPSPDSRQQPQSPPPPPPPVPNAPPNDAPPTPEDGWHRENRPPPPNVDPEIVKNIMRGVEMTLNSMVNEYYVSMTIIVASQSHECYFYPSGGPFVVQFEVVGGGGTDIGVHVSDQFGGVVREIPLINRAEIRVDVPHHMLQTHYRICFDTRRGGGGSRHVFVNIGLEREVRRALLHAMQARGKKMEETEKMEVSMDMFYDSLNFVDQRVQAMMNLQHRRRGMERFDRLIMEANLSRVTNWSALQLLVMIGVAVLQVITIRSLFDDRSFSGKIMRHVWNVMDRVLPRVLIAPGSVATRSPHSSPTSVSFQRPSC